MGRLLFLWCSSRPDKGCGQRARTRSAVWGRRRLGAAVLRAEHERNDVAIVYVLLSDETVAQVSSEYGTYEACSVQEFADWDVRYAEPLWDAVVWLRYHMRRLRECTRAMRTSGEPKWRALKASVESEGFDAAESIVAELGPDQYEEIGKLVAKDRRRFVFEIPYKEARIPAGKKTLPTSSATRTATRTTTLRVGFLMRPRGRHRIGFSAGPTSGGTI
jgi:hypothetical protein